MLNLKDAAKKLQVSVFTLRRYIKSEKLNATKLGREYVLNEEDLENLLTKQKLISEADQLVLKGLNDQTEFQYHSSRQELMRKARDLYKEAGESKLAERANFDANIFGYTLKNILAKNESKAKWGRFVPIGIFKDKDGKEIYFPDPAWIDDSMLKHALERTKETKNPITLTTYYDLLFEHSKIANKLNLVLEAINNYLFSAEIQQKNNWNFEMIDSLLRSLELSILIKNKELSKEVINEIYKYIKNINKTGNPRFSLELFEGLLAFSKHLSKAQIKKIIQEARIGENYFGSLKGDNRHIQRSFLNVIESAYGILADEEQKRKTRLEVADSYLKEADEKSGSGLVEAHFLEEALNIIRNLKDPRKEEAKIRKKIENAYLRAESEMKPITATFEITEKQKQDFIKSVLVENPEESLIRIGILPQLIPNVKHAEEQTKKLMEKYPLQYLFSKKTIQSGRKITFSSGGFEINEDAIIENLGRDHLTVNSFFLGFVFDELKKRGVGAAKISTFLRDKDLYKNYDNFDAITSGFESYEKGDYFSALGILVPQVENVLRESLRALGFPTMRVDRDGSQKAIMIAEILDAPPLKEILGIDRYWYFRLIMYDKRGKSLRDNLAHGFLKKSRQNEPDCNLILHLLFILANLGIKDGKTN